MKTRFIGFLWLCVCCGIGVPAHAAPVVVLAAAATSSAPGAASVTCLLDPGCQGVWSAGAADNGIDDGLYVQFEQPVMLHFIKVTFELAAEPYAVRNAYELYLNGKTRNARGVFGAGEGPVTAPNTLFFGVRNTADPVVDAVKENVRSVFLKLTPRDAWAPGTNRVKRIEFLGPDQAVIPLALPTLIPATVTATSVLEPVSAYHPANLFDARYDFAWSTDGKKTPGRGESVTLTLPTPQAITGLMVWNGYQRSPEHFKANGRVTALAVQADARPPQVVRVLDQLGPQRVALNPPLADARRITFTIREIAAGATYKDVLLSELRLVGVNGTLLLPQTELPKVTPPPAFQGLVDRSFASFVHQPITGGPTLIDGSTEADVTFCDNARIRVRANGTFVIYKDFDYGTSDSAARPANINANVLEGNWEPKGDALRIFGRKYVTTLRESEYGGSATTTTRTEIFQSDVRVKPYTALTAAEKTELFAYLWQKKKGPAAKAQPFAWIIKKDHQRITGAQYGELIKRMDAALTALNPYYLHSSVLNDLLLPADDVDTCVTYTL